MTELSREILRDWQIRKTKAQKLRFIEFMQSRLPGLTVEEGGWPKCRNLVLGDPENADVIFTAHYDTCARLPFPNFITPKNLLIYLLYQLLILIPFFAAAGLLAWGLVDFDGLFVTFHRIAFTNEGWLLDPSKDLLIRLMPVEFFIALAVRCLLWLAGTAAVTGIVSYELCRIIPPAGGGTEKPGNRPDPGAGNQL